MTKHNITRFFDEKVGHVVVAGFWRGDVLRLYGMTDSSRRRYLGILIKAALHYYPFRIVPVNSWGERQYMVKR